ncbi:MAG TPA: Nif3-like dinuclear metal center hexameric protein [Bacteroidales bacterium]|nr:Nif3-like dinuclear metal center hexameric protein [Bacteroidales bacterium]
MKIIISLLTGLLIIQGTVLAQTKEAMSAESVIETVIKKTGAKPITGTVDVIKAGDPQAKVTGIVVCMFATMDVLKTAVEHKCNLIIAHEPLFYNHLDETKSFADDPVYLDKKKFIDENKLVIWRFHDYIHSMKPDGISKGMAIKLRWENYSSGGSLNSFILPETTLGELVSYLKKIFPGQSFNVVGDPSMKVSRVAFAEGAPGSAVHFFILRDKNTDVLIGGEVPQWETYEYVRDAVLQGKHKAAIFLGHIPSEDAGMEYAAQWIKTFITGVPVAFVDCGPSYTTY